MKLQNRKRAVVRISVDEAEDVYRLDEAL